MWLLNILSFLLFVCVCTNRNKSQSCPCAESVSWELGGQGIWTERRECNMLTGKGGVREVEKQRNAERRRLQEKDRAEEGEIEQRLGE